MRRFTKILFLLCLTSCSQIKDIALEKKAPPPKKNIDELFEPSLKIGAKKENSALLLIPMSGRNEAMGRSILNACLLTVEDAKNIDFYVVDSADFSMEKFAMYDRFKNLKAVIGPISPNEAKQYGALFPKTPILSFSNNSKINGDHVFACGLSLRDEIQALLEYADSQNIGSFLLMLPEGVLGDQIVEIMKSELKKNGLEEGDDLEIVRYNSISRNDATKHVQNSGKKAVFAINPIIKISELEDMHVFTISSAALANGEAWEGAIIAFMNNEEQQKFSEKYRLIFGTQPTTHEMVAYDLIKITKEAAKLGKPIVGSEHSGCLGKFSIDKKTGLKRELQIFRVEDPQKSESDKESMESREEPTKRHYDAKF